MARPETNNRYLQEIARGTGASGGAPVSISQTTPGTTNAVQLTGAQVTPASSTINTSGTVAAGKFYVEFILSPSDADPVVFAGTILGVAYNGTSDALKAFEAPAGRTLGAIAYTISAGSARLTTI